MTSDEDYLRLSNEYVDSIHTPQQPTFNVDSVTDIFYGFEDFAGVGSSDKMATTQTMQTSQTTQTQTPSSTHMQMHEMIPPDLLALLQTMQNIDEHEIEPEGRVAASTSYNATESSQIPSNDASDPNTLSPPLSASSSRTMLTKDQKRANHLRCEQKRRLEQKAAYDGIASLVQRENANLGAQSSSAQSKVKCRSSNTSKGVLLTKAVSLVDWLQRTNACLEKEVEKWEQEGQRQPQLQ